MKVIYIVYMWVGLGVHADNNRCGYTIPWIFSGILVKIQRMEDSGLCLIWTKFCQLPDHYRSAREVICTWWGIIPQQPL